MNRIAPAWMRQYANRVSQIGRNLKPPAFSAQQSRPMEQVRAYNRRNAVPRAQRWTASRQRQPYSYYGSFPGEGDRDAFLAAVSSQAQNTPFLDRLRQMTQGGA